MKRGLSNSTVKYTDRLLINDNPPMKEVDPWNPIKSCCQENTINSSKSSKTPGRVYLSLATWDERREKNIVGGKHGPSIKVLRTSVVIILWDDKLA